MAALCTTRLYNDIILAYMVVAMTSRIPFRLCDDTAAGKAIILQYLLHMWTSANEWSAQRLMRDWASEPPLRWPAVRLVAAAIRRTSSSSGTPTRNIALQSCSDLDRDSNYVIQGDSLIVFNPVVSFDNVFVRVLIFRIFKYQDECYTYKL